MTAWDVDDPSRGDADLLDGVVARLLTQWGTCSEAAESIAAAADAVRTGWTGQVADAWTGSTGILAAEARALAEPVRATAETLSAYAGALRDLRRRVQQAHLDLDDAGRSLSRARERRAAVQVSDEADDGERRSAQAAIQRAEEDQALARNALAQMARERERADEDMIAAFRRVLPGTWAAGGGLTSTLPVTALQRGPATLAWWVRSLPDDADGDDALRWLVEQLSDQDFDALLAACPELARRLMRADASGDFAVRYPDLDAALAITDPAERVAAVAAACAALPPGDLTVLARCYPAVVNNLDGAPLTVRIAANRVAITAAKVDAEEALAAIRALTAGREAADIHPLQQTLLDSFAGAVAWYDELLYGTVDSRDADGRSVQVTGHQVMLFYPGAGQFGELVGYAGAPNIAVLLGGTGTNVTNMDGQQDRAWSLVNGADGGRLAVITYLGGPMPQSVFPEAVNAAYAQNIAPHLASFVNGVRATTGATITVAGHSYGGSVVGAAEVVGMVADRILHVSSAGAGPGVGSVQDYAAPDTPRYSMTAPGDLIGLSQGASVGTVLGHGSDPDTLAGVTRLETGRVDSQDPTSALVQGSTSHSGVFDVTSDLTVRTDAWENMLAVMTGGSVSLWTEPTMSAGFDTSGGSRADLRYPMEDPGFVPPRQEIG